MTDAGPSWKEFETLVERLQRAFHPTAKITRNEKLPGRNSGGLRQIDISVREKFGLQEMLIIVECKQWRRKVDVKTVEAFVGVKDDVGAHAGIIVSASGSTRGARNTAARNHINIYSYRDTKSEQWPNGLKVPIVVEGWILRPHRFTLKDAAGTERELTSDTQLNVFDATTRVPLNPAAMLMESWQRNADRTEGNFTVLTPVSRDGAPPFAEELSMSFHVRCERYLRDGRLHFAGAVDEEKRQAHTQGFQIIVEGESKPLEKDAYPRNFAGIGLVVACTEVETEQSLKSPPKRNLAIFGTIEVELNSPHPIVIELDAPTDKTLRPMFSTEKEFEAGARAIAIANRISTEKARTYLSFVGDTPELTEDGLTIVRNLSGREVARIVSPLDA